MTRKPSPIYLCAPVNAVVEGIYQERIPFSKILQHGDFGLGTFDSLDGEMIVLDGRVYQITGDGQVHEVGEEATTPFACVTFYAPASHDDLDEELGYAAFQDWLLSLLPSPNLFYALRLEGTFAHVKVRSVPRQENYRPLVEVVADQPVFEFTEVEGTLAGFFSPAFLESLTVPGLHLHFLSADRTQGGHLLECRPRRLRAGVQFISTLELGLPMSLDYLTWDLRSDIGADLDMIEK
ncbi:MAG: acetolactate decarboxylase [Actinomycetes bacterium]